MSQLTFEGDPNSPVPGGLNDTTYLVYVDDSGDERQDLLTALAIPVEVWSSTLESWKKFRRWTEKKLKVPPDVELHALELGTNAKGRGALAHLPSGDRNKLSMAAFNTLKASGMLRVLTVYAPLPEGSGGLYDPLVAFLEEFCEFHRSHAVVWYDGTAASLETVTRSVHRRLPYSRRVLEDPRGYSSKESHLIQMVDFIAYSAHQAVLNDRGLGSSDTFLREKAYQSLLPTSSSTGLIWPGAHDADKFPAFDHELGIREYPPPKAR